MAYVVLLAIAFIATISINSSATEPIIILDLPPPEEYPMFEGEAASVDAKDSEGEMLQAEDTDPTATVIKALVWSVDNSSAFEDEKGNLSIFVCWVNPERRHSTWRKLVKSSIAETWEKYSNILFTGWGRCSTGETTGIKILVVDSDSIHPSSKIGIESEQHEVSMILNFDFMNWARTCRGDSGLAQETCIHSLAVHEFGHALGFRHEDLRLTTLKDTLQLSDLNRLKLKKACLRQPSTDSSITRNSVWTNVYDPDSVMNYCNNIYKDKVKLSMFDIEALQTHY